MEISARCAYINCACDDDVKALEVAIFLLEKIVSKYSA
jgi:hypothetical protein